MIDRRELIQRVGAVLGGALSSGAALGVLSGCVATPTPAAGAGLKFLTADEMKIATAMSEQIIPRTDTPGAIDLGVPAFIDKMMGDFYQDREKSILRAGLARAEADARTAHGKGFAELTSDQQVALMTVYDREAVQQARASATTPNAPVHFFRLMKELTTVGFFTTEVGSTQLLRYSAVPGPYRGDVPLSEIGRTWAS
jgi:hypothetical protein